MRATPGWHTFGGLCCLYRFAYFSSLPSSVLSAFWVAAEGTQPAGPVASGRRGRSDDDLVHCCLQGVRGA